MTELSWYSAEDVVALEKGSAGLRDAEAREAFVFRDAAGEYHGSAGDGRWMRYDGERWVVTERPRRPLEGPAGWGRSSTLFSPPARDALEEEARRAGAADFVADKVKEVLEAYRRGEITSDQAESLGADLLLLDRTGVVWTVGFSSGRWHRFADGSWTPTDGPPGPETLALTGDAPIQCPSCGSLTDGARFCPSCGTQLPRPGVPETRALVDFLNAGIGATPEPVTEPWDPPTERPTGDEEALELEPEAPELELEPESVVPPEALPVAFCPSCGTPALEGAAFCAACGNRLPGLVVSPSATPQPAAPAPAPESPYAPPQAPRATAPRKYAANPARAPAPAEAPAARHEMRLSGASIVAAVVVVLLAGAAAGWWFFLRDDERISGPRPGGGGLTQSCISTSPAFTVKYPNGWSMSEGPDLDCRFFHPEPFELIEGTDSFSLAVSIQPDQGRYRPVVAGATDPSYVRVLSREDATIGGGWPGVLIEVQVTDPVVFPTGTRLYGYIADVNGRAWILQTIGLAGLDYDTNKLVVDRMASTIEIS
ncbi:MAG TPA: zinc ribbon domain-containing protein [Actinomycetota bacterium]|nr:zinc ribbon domain-containing protein [Actinomycetota bacterium]